MRRNELIAKLPPDRVLEIRSVASFVHQVEELRGRRQHPTTFRGQLSLDSLYPSLTRTGGPARGAKADDLGRIERMLLDGFRRRLPKPSQRPLDYWETRKVL